MTRQAKGLLDEHGTEWADFKERGLVTVYLNSLRHHTMIKDGDELRDLFSQVHANGDVSARNRLTEANLRLVPKMAWGHQSRRDNECLDFLDLIQEGNIGLMRAVEKYDQELGYAFSTYAHWWIKHGITRAIADDGKLIRTPVNRLDERARIVKVISSFEKRMGREPTNAEIADALSVSEEVVENAKTYMQTKVFDIDAPLPRGGEDDQTLADYAADDSVRSPEERAIAQDYAAETRRSIETFLVRCSDREKRAFILRYGLDGRNAPRTLEQVGFLLCVTRERARQILEKAWDKVEGLDHQTDGVFDLVKELRSIVHRKTIRESKKAAEKGRRKGAKRLSERTCLTCHTPLSRYNTGDRCFRHPFPPAEEPKPQGHAREEQVHEAEAQKHNQLAAGLFLHAVAKVYSVDVEQLRRPDKKSRALIWARQLVMYLLNEDLAWTAKQIAELFELPVPTATWACNKVRQKLKGKPARMLMSEIRSCYEGFRPKPPKEKKTKPRASRPAKRVPTKQAKPNDSIVLRTAADVLGLTIEQIRKPGKDPERVWARRVAAHLLHTDLGWPTGKVAEALRVSYAAAYASNRDVEQQAEDDVATWNTLAKIRARYTEARSV